MGKGHWIFVEGTTMMPSCGLAKKNPSNDSTRQIPIIRTKIAFILLIKPELEKLKDWA